MTNRLSFDRIIVYGCSYTAGDELLDAEWFDLAEKDIDILKKEEGGNSNLFNFYKKYKNKKYCSDHTLFDIDGNWLFHEAYERQKNQTWSRWLADKFGVPCVNRALGGASVEYCLYSFNTDVILGNITPTDLVLFAITSPHRWFYINSQGYPQRCLMGFVDNCWPSKNFYNEYLLHINNPYQAMWDYYLQLRHIEEMSKNNPNIKMFFINNSNDEFSGGSFAKSLLGDCEERSLSPDHIMWKMLDSVDNFTCLLSTDDWYAFNSGLKFIKEDEPTHGFGHPRISSHKKMADQLYEVLR